MCVIIFAAKSVLSIAKMRNFDNSIHLFYESFLRFDITKSAGSRVWIRVSNLFRT